MVSEQLIQLSVWAALIALALGMVAEWLHARRVRRVGRLAFGPDERPRAWTMIAPPIRVLALTGLTWSLVVLLAHEGSSRLREHKAAATRHLMLLLDVSPSMEMQDAGKSGTETRRDRAATLIKSVMERANNDQTRITMGCFYSDALLLVKECSDRELIWNFADNLPLHIAFSPGKTSLMKSLNTAGNFVKDFPRKSVTFVVLTDGDTVPDSGLNRLPSAVSDLIVVGVGNAGHGTYIDGHLSRQDSASLSQLARRLGGTYHDGNRKQVPSALLHNLTAPDERQDSFQIGIRTGAIITLSVCAALLCLLPILLDQFGSDWKSVAPITTRTATVPTGREVAPT